MFDFERLELYQVIRNQNKLVFQFILESPNLDTHLRDQWKRSSINAVLHLTEGVSRTMDLEKKQYFAMARSAIYEGTAMLQLARDLELVHEGKYIELYNNYEQISKMLLGMYRSIGAQ